MIKISHQSPSVVPDLHHLLVWYLDCYAPPLCHSESPRIDPRPVWQFHSEDSIYISSTRVAAQEFPALSGRALI